jgi:hypothetical protein
MTSVIRINTDGSGASGLEPVSFVPAEAILAGVANEKGESHYETKDGSIVIGTWESTPYAEILTYPATTETVFVLSGKVAITEANGALEVSEAGDAYVLPKGFSGRFEVLETLRKIYILVSDK